jgi:hypothetical protein
MSPYAALGVGPEDLVSARVHEVRALLTLAPRSAATSWTGRDLRRWVQLTTDVGSTEIRDALVSASICGASPADIVPAAAHVALTRIAPTLRGEDAVRDRRNIEDVCTHLRAHVGRQVAAQLPRLQPEPEDVSRAAVWAYFFASTAMLLLVLVLTR